MSKTLDVMTQNNWAYGGSAGFARYEFSDDFVDEDGREFEAGPKSYLEVATTISGSVVTVPAYPNFPTTERAILNNGVTVTCHLLDSNRQKRTTLFEDCRIYTSLPSVISLSQLVLANGASRLLRDTDVWTKEQVIDYVETRPPAEKMTSLIYGTGRLSVPAVSAADPIAAGDNDHRLVSNVYNVNAYPYNAVGDGVTNDRAAIQAALTAAGITGGVVVLPGRYFIGSSIGLAVPSNVLLAALFATDTPNILYSGSGIAVDSYGSSYAGMENLHVQTTNDAATGFRIGNLSRWCWGKRLTHQGNSSATNTGLGFDLDARGGSGQFSGFLYLEQIYSLGSKFGISTRGTNTGNETWTTIWMNGVTLVGRPAGIISASIGIKTDNQSNLEGSSINNLIIEGFDKPYEFANGASCFGFSITNSGNEGNNNGPEFPAGWNGEAFDPHDDGHYQRSTSNGLANFWDRELRRAGEWTTESLGKRIHVIYPGSSADVQWGLQRGESIIDGGLARDKFIVSTSVADNASYFRNWFKLLECKHTHHNAVPTEGSWGIGSRIDQSIPAVGSPTGWLCTASGTFKTALVGVTGGITSGQRSLVVNSVSTLTVGDYISIVGVSGTKLIVKISGTTITVDTDSDATVAAAAVQYVTPTFQPIDNLGTARGSRVVSQFNSTSDALGNVPGLSVMLEAGLTYTFVARLHTTSNVAAGVKAAIGGTCTPASFICSALVFDAGAVSGPTRTSTKGNTVGNVTAVTAAYIEITGTIQTSAAGGGTLTVQFAQNVLNGAASSVLINSTLETQLIG